MEVKCQCPLVGANNETLRAFTARTESRGLYLNVAHPAPCNGTINGWRYCFYMPNDIGDYIYSAAFAVYRATDTRDNVDYQRVSDVTTVSWHGKEISELSRFNCYNISVEAFTITAGDIVAACIYGPRSSPRRQLGIIGSDAAGYSLLRLGTSCNKNSESLPSNVLSSQLTNRDSKILHLELIYAAITCMFKCICTTLIDFIIITVANDTVLQ